MKSALDVRVKLLEHGDDIINAMVNLALGKSSERLMEEEEIKALHVCFIAICPRMSLTDDNLGNLKLKAIFDNNTAVPAYQRSAEVLQQVACGELSPEMGKILIELSSEVFMQKELNDINVMLEDMPDRTSPPKLRAV